MFLEFYYGECELVPLILQWGHDRENEIILL